MTKRVKQERPHNGYCFVLQYSGPYNRKRVFGPFVTPMEAILSAVNAFKLNIPLLRDEQKKAKERGFIFRPTVSKVYQVSNPRDTLSQEYISFVTIETLERVELFGR